MGVDFTKATFDSKTGFLSIPTETGYDIHMRLTPTLKLDPVLGQNNEPAFFAQLNIIESNTTSKANGIKTQKELDNFIKKLPFIPTNYDYEDFLVGFIYSNEQDPMNHQWFLQFRNKQGNILDSIPVAHEVDISCPSSTFSWFEGNWHGRMKITPKELKDVKEISPGHIEIIGNKCGGYPKGDTSIAPEGTEKLAIRYNIFKNKWYVHFMTKEEKDLKQLECDSIITDCKSKGFINRNHPKPKVTQQVQMKDVASIQYLSNTAIIYGI